MIGTIDANSMAICAAVIACCVSIVVSFLIVLAITKPLIDGLKAILDWMKSQEVINKEMAKWANDHDQLALNLIKRTEHRFERNSDEPKRS